MPPKKGEPMTRVGVLLVILLTAVRLQADDTPAPGQELDGLQSACDRHDQHACARLAGVYIFGDGATLRPEKARAFLRGICTIGYGKDHMEACTTSSAGLACRRLGDIYANGESVPRCRRVTRAPAPRCARRAARSGS
jgi:TPR repeat protein